MGVLLRFWIRIRVCAVLEGEVEGYDEIFSPWNSSFWVVWHTGCNAKLFFVLDVLILGDRLH